MFRMIKILLNAAILVLALVGFNAIGGQKYVEMAKDGILNIIQSHKTDIARQVGDFSKLNEEFEIDRTANIMGYKAVIAEHKASGQKLVILDSGKKALLTKDEINGKGIEEKLTELANKIRYKSISVKDITVTNRGNMEMYGQTVPYAKFEAHVSKLPFSDVSGIVASVKTTDGSEKLALSLSEKKKYSQLITNEFFKEVGE